MQINQERNAGVDMLKILLAPMVISIHFFAPATGAVMNVCEKMPMRLFSIIMMGMVYPAVNCYVLITAYFSFGQKKTFHGVISSLIKLWSALLMYSVFGYIFSCVVDYQAFSIVEFVKRFFPIIRGEWWFMSVYFALIITSPFILDYLEGITIQKHRLIVILSFFSCSVCPFFTKWKDNLGLNMGYSYLWFVVLFLIGTYLKRINITGKNNVFVCIVGYLLCSILNQAVSFVTARIPYLNGYQVATYNSFVVCFQAIFMFLIFAKIRFSPNGGRQRIISGLASLSMASYIFHCQEDIGGWFWTATHPGTYANSYSLFIVYVVTVFGLYLVSVIIEVIRRRIICILGFEAGLQNTSYRVILRLYRVLDTSIESKFEK